LRLRALTIVSGLYDLSLGITMLFFARQTAVFFGAPAPVPLLNAELNGLFATALALGYFWAAGDLQARRGYLWSAGVFAKGCGAVLFVLDHLRGGSPDSFLVFAVTDGTLAILTAWFLLAERA
jgi:hypothetical protein